MRILIAAKRESLRNALNTLIKSCSGIAVVGTAADDEELFKVVDMKQPDLLLLDEDLNQGIIDAVLVPIKMLDPSLSIIMLGRRSEFKEAYLEAGAVSFLTKDTSPKRLLSAIEEARLQSNHVL